MNEHWIIYREQQDPPGVRFIAVCHSAEEASAALDDAAELEARAVNEARQARFDSGQECGHEVSAADFTHAYITAHIVGL